MLEFVAEVKKDVQALPWKDPKAMDRFLSRVQHVCLSVFSSLEDGAEEECCSNFSLRVGWKSNSETNWSTIVETLTTKKYTEMSKKGPQS